MKKTERKTKASTNRISNSAEAGAEANEYLSLVEIKELIELIAEKQFSEFELERGSFRLRLQKGAGKAIVEASPQAAAAPMVANESRPVEIAAPAPPEESLHIIASPIVGTFFRAASPEAESFV